jgi:C-3',4' desaturase CrtD
MTDDFISDPDSLFDVVVVGGGMGGLAAAALAQRVGLRTALLESHTKLGGCAGYFRRDGFQFDVGATALIGFEPGAIVGDLLAVLGIGFQTEPTSSYRVHLPDRTVDIVADDRRFEESLAAAFPAPDGFLQTRRRLFWRLQAAVGRSLFAATARVPRFPLQSTADLVHDLRALGLSGILAGATAVLTVGDVLRALGLYHDPAFRALIAILLEDTAQAGPDVVPFANAAACIEAYRRGMCRPRGGMAALVEGIGQRLAELGGALRTATLVDRIEPAGDHAGAFVVTTRRRQRFLTRDVVLNLPLDLAARLLGRSLEGTLNRAERKSRAAWSAFTGYLAIDQFAVDRDTPLFHQVLRSYDLPTHDGNNVLVSLSPPGDSGYGPPRVRVATLSTHTRPADWQDLDDQAFAAKKALFQSRLIEALGRALPVAPSALLHAEFASPRSFKRYTRRNAGAVGGAPVGRSNSNFFAVDSAVFGPGLWVVGDSVFPGQGTMATVVSAIRVIERITGESWHRIRRSCISPRESLALSEVFDHS